MSSPSGSSVSSQQSHNWHRDSDAGSSSRTTPEPSHLHQHHHHHHHPHHQHHHLQHLQHLHHLQQLQHSKILAQTHPHQQHPHHQQHQHHQTQHSQHPGGVSRRSSTPAQAFLPPRFYSPTVEGSAPISESSSSSSSSDPNNHGNPTTAPRRTSFGTALTSGRLGALSALRGASSWNQPQLSPTLSASSAAPVSVDASHNERSQTPTTVTASPRFSASLAHASNDPAGNLPLSQPSSAAASPTLQPNKAQQQYPYSQHQQHSSPIVPLSSSASGVPHADLGPSAVSAPSQPAQYERRHICVPDGCGGFVTIDRSRSRKKTT
ncbi:unnamed protein product [Jaminaea pallidilutea]